MSATAKKTSPQSSLNDGDANLPEGWTAVTLGEVVASMKNGIYKAATSYSENGVPCLRMYNVESGRIVWKNVKPMRLSRAEIDEYRLLPGDLLVNRVNSRELVGKSAVIPVSLEPTVFESKNIRVRLRYEMVIPEIANYQLLLSGQDYFKYNCQQVVGMASISQPQVANFPLLLPPLQEQQRIIAKIEELLQRVDAARARLAKVRHILKRFRQAVLAAACSGRLTEGWRERNQLPKNIGETVDAIRLRREAVAKSPAERKKIWEIYEYSETTEGGRLPEGWGFVALNKLCVSFDYGTSTKSQPTGEVPVLRMGNIQAGKIDWSDLVYTSDDEEIKKYSLNPKTVLFNRTNSPELVGKTALYQGERRAIFAGYLIRIVTFPDLDPSYLNLCLNTNHAKEFCLEMKTDGVSQSNINAQKLGMFEVPYCCSAEQHEIVRRVEALFKLADSIEKRVEEGTKRSEKLTQAILAKAFRGELVPTEAELARRQGRDYEPASVLLARIKAERESARLHSSNGNSRPRGPRKSKRE